MLVVRVVQAVLIVSSTWVVSYTLIVVHSLVVSIVLIVVVILVVTGVPIVRVVSKMRVGLIGARIPIIRVTPSPCPSDTPGARIETPNAVASRGLPGSAATHPTRGSRGGGRRHVAACRGNHRFGWVRTPPRIGGRVRFGRVSPDRPHSLRSEPRWVKSGRSPEVGQEVHAQA
jgi:hypothetical protein